MGLSFIVNILTVVVVAFMVWLYGRDRRPEYHRAAYWLKFAALVPLALQMVTMVLPGADAAAAEETSAVWPLVRLVGIALVAAAAWLRPIEGGIGLIISALLASIGFFGALFIPNIKPEDVVTSPSLLISAAPQFVAGVLFLTAGIIGRRESPSNPNLRKTGNI